MYILIAVRFAIQKFRNILRDRQISQVELQRLTMQRFPPDGVSLIAIRKILTGTRNGRYIAWKLALTLGLPEDYFSVRTKVAKKRRRVT